MRRVFKPAAVLTVLAAVSGCNAGKAPAEPNPPTITEAAPAAPDPSRPVASGNTEAAADVAAAAGLRAYYDPQRDPIKDLETAMVEAQRGGKRIVLDVGSETCVPCQTLDDEIETHPELRSARDAGFIWVKVNASDENLNAEFLAAYPSASDAPPHLIVLDAAGALLHAQPATAFTQGDEESLQALQEFLQQWSPQGADPADAATP